MTPHEILFIVALFIYLSTGVIHTVMGIIGAYQRQYATPEMESLSTALGAIRSAGAIIFLYLLVCTDLLIHKSACIFGG